MVFTPFCIQNAALVLLGFGLLVVVVSNCSATTVNEDSVQSESKPETSASSLSLGSVLRTKRGYGHGGGGGGGGGGHGSYGHGPGMYITFGIFYVSPE